MTSNPMNIAKHLHVPKQNEQTGAETAGVMPEDLKREGLKIANLMQMPKEDERDLSRSMDSYSAFIKQVLGVIGPIENMLQEKRKRIEELQARHDNLMREHRQVSMSLESVTSELADQFADVVGQLGNDYLIAKPPAVDLDMPSRHAADDVPTPVSDEDLDPEVEDFPPVPEFFSEDPKPSKDGAASKPESVQSSASGWWKRG